MSTSSKGSVQADGSASADKLKRLWTGFLDRPGTSRFSTRHPWLTVVLAISLFFALDGAIFRTGLYQSYMSIGSFQGTFFHTVAREAARPVAKKPSVLVLGNSTIEWGFSPRQVFAEHPGSAINIFRGDVGGAFEKTWYYELQRIDPSHDKFDYILFPLASYKIDSYRVDRENDYETVRQVSTILKLGEWPGFVRSYSDPAARYRVAMLGLFPGHGYALDVQDFLLHVKRRLRQMADLKEAGDAWRFDGGSRPGTFADLEIDDAGHVNKCPDTFALIDCDSVAESLRRPSVEDAQRFTLRNAAYRGYWTNRIAELYADSPTTLLFIQMPRWPIPMPDRIPVEGAPDIRDMVKTRAKIIFADETLFTSLETPHYFHDQLHLNVEGREYFTSLLGQLLIKVVAKK